MTTLDDSFPCMGSTARLVLEGPQARVEAAASAARDLLAELEARWTRFAPGSDLVTLGGDPQPEVPAHVHVRALARAGAWAGRASGGLVDMTLAREIVAAGYAGDFDPARRLPLAEAFADAPPRRPAGPHPAARWRALGADDAAGTVFRPPGVELDSGGIGKGLAADLVLAHVRDLRAVVDVGGDIALGGLDGRPVDVDVEHPITGGVAHRLRLAGGAVATSSIGRRIWRGADGAPAHHLLDPSTGRPAWTGLLAVTAVARTALEAEVLAKTALLSGPTRATRVLAARGGVLVAEDGDVRIVPPLRALAARAARARGIAA